MSSLDEVIKKIFKILKIDMKLVVKNKKSLIRMKEIKKIGCRIDNIKNDLNWKPKFSINQIIPKLIKNELF